MNVFVNQRLKISKNNNMCKAFKESLYPEKFDSNDYDPTKQHVEG